MHGIFAALPLVIVLLATTMWWKALKPGDDGRSRWVGLVAPFFIVVGAAAGVAASSMFSPSPGGAATSYCYRVVTDRFGVHWMINFGEG